MMLISVTMVVVLLFVDIRCRDCKNNSGDSDEAGSDDFGSDDFGSDDTCEPVSIYQ